LLNICIAAPFWLSWWFISLVLFISGRILYAKAQEDYGIEKENKEKQITEAKFEALSNQMNPHFIFNALNSIQDYVGQMMNIIPLIY
jgi:LytS/YehU family sensor histidine kinase